MEHLAHRLEADARVDTLFDRRFGHEEDGGGADKTRLSRQPANHPRGDPAPPERSPDPDRGDLGHTILRLRKEPSAHRLSPIRDSREDDATAMLDRAANPRPAVGARRSLTVCLVLRGDRCLKVRGGGRCDELDSARWLPIDGC